VTDAAKEPAEVQLPLGTGNAWIELNMPTPLDLPLTRPPTDDKEWNETRNNGKYDSARLPARPPSKGNRQGNVIGSQRLAE
jgi:hypothetical protein